MNSTAQQLIRARYFCAGLFLSASLIYAGGCQSSASPAEERAPVEQTRDEAERETAEQETEQQARRFAFVYEATIMPGDAEGPVDIFLPIAESTQHQKILDVVVESPVVGDFGAEKAYGNRFWHAALDALPADPLTIRVRYRVERQPFSRRKLYEADGREYSEEALEQHARFLQANQRVPVDGQIVDRAIADIGFAPDDSLPTRARKIYDYVVDTMEYKKVGDGWGNGDTYWACSERYGNCTDFHALFTSLARHEGIPARFEIGFPVPTDRSDGTIGGYHCWVQFYLPGVGWTPIDASEAKKHPEMRELYFGSQPANRVRLSVGRDLNLGEAHDAGPLNYFVYPHVEAGKQRYEAVETRFAFEEITP